MALKIALTGGIGSGKSEVLKMVKQEGYPVFSCDEIYRGILTEQTYVESISKAFPQAVTQNKIDKKILASIIFSRAEARETLNAIAHPLVMQKLHFCMEQSTASLVFAEVPLLFESGLENGFDKIVILMRPIEERIQAVCSRDGMARSEVLARIRAQFNYDDEKAIAQKIKNGAHVLINDGSPDHLATSVKALLELLKKDNRET